MGANEATKTIAILGAGCAGLAAGIRLSQRGYQVVILEQEDHVGGLAGGVHLNGNTYEYGPHTFHTTDAEILHDIKSLMGDELVPYRRTILIKFLGKYFAFPLAIRDVIFKLPLTTVIHAGLSFLWHFVTGNIRKPREENSETILKRYYGNVLYEIFFKTYITSVWGITPAEFSPSFARQRIPRLNILDVWDKLVAGFQNRLKRVSQTDNFVEKVEGELWTTRKGFSLITQKMAEQVIQHGGLIELNARVTRIIREGSRVCAIDYLRNGEMQSISPDAVINTLPLNETTLMMEPAFDSVVVESAQALKFRALVFVGLLVRRPQVLPSSFMYFRQHSFNRISDLAQFGFHVTPSGSTQLVAEISCDVTDRVWTDDEYAKQMVIQDLLAEKLLAADEITEVFVFRARHAYPIYTLHYEDHLARLLTTVQSMTNMETAGRQGRFQYVNTHIAMKMGYQAADRIITKLGG
jgi:protoporphyrinogen oxidase